MSSENVLSSFDYWRLCDELNIIQAALLVAGSDPSLMENEVERWSADNRPTGYEAAKNAISRALRRNKIQGQLIPKYEYDINGNYAGPIEGSINLDESTVEVDSLKDWLMSRGMTTGFFFAPRASQPGYLNPDNPRYAPKLAAAVTAWLAFDDVALLGRSPKQSLVKWLREHAAEFDLSNDDGNPNETGIEEVAKVANWQPGGGAPRTPGG